MTNGHGPDDKPLTRPTSAAVALDEDDANGAQEWVAFFDDPDGNTLALMSRVAVGAG